MRVDWLALTDFRSYQSLEWGPDPGINLLVGPNGAGKTNLLEAVGYLATLKSFRSVTDEAIVAYAKVAAPQVGILAGLAASYARCGNAAGAEATRKRLLELAPKFSARRFVDFRPFLHERDRMHLLQGLEKAGLPP